jgi:hypothetical protein
MARTWDPLIKSQGHDMVPKAYAANGPNQPKKIPPAQAALIEMMPACWTPNHSTFELLERGAVHTYENKRGLRSLLLWRWGWQGRIVLLSFFGGRR